MQPTIKIVFIVTLAIYITSCAMAVPFIQAFKSMGITPADRKAKFEPVFKKFTQALYWGNAQEALSYASDDAKPALLEVARRIASGKERITETKMLLADFSEYGSEVTVNVMIKSYRVPVYVVVERQESQKWEYSTTDSWQLIDIKEVKE
jgi:hypothetical protein